MRFILVSFIFNILILYCHSFLLQSIPRYDRYNIFMTSSDIKPSTEIKSIPNNNDNSNNNNIVGGANLDWPSLGFQYIETDSFVFSSYENGKWGDIQVSTSPYLPIHIGATALHYGQACFEGLKAFHCADGKVRIFRPQENAKRIGISGKRICMPIVEEKLFLQAIRTVIKQNLKYVPPYGTGGALYLRPLLFGSGPRIGLQPSESYIFLVLALPVADYYKGGLKPVDSVVVEDYDRAAPRGVGNVKVAGNYAADILPNTLNKKAGYPISLYLDAKTNSYIEEFSTSNFFAIDHSGAFITPDSDAILKSITNKSLMEIAIDEGMEVQMRKVKIDELMSGKFKEVAACGTAVVITPISSVTYKDKTVNFGSEKQPVGPVLQKLYSRVRAIQNGEEEDKFNWMVEL